MANEELIKAHRGKKTGVFSQAAWASGSPQRYGWIADIDSTPKKTLPQEILDFADIRKKARPVKEDTAPPPEIPKIQDDEPIVKTVAAAAPKPKPKRKPTAKKGAKR